MSRFPQITYNSEISLWFTALKALIFPNFVSDMPATFFKIPNCRVNYPPSLITSLCRYSLIYSFSLKWLLCSWRALFLLKLHDLVRGYRQQLLIKNSKPLKAFFSCIWSCDIYKMDVFALQKLQQMKIYISRST